MTVTNHAEDPSVDSSLNTAPASDDHALLTRVHAGEDAGFAELFARHAGPVRGYALRLVKDPADAEDIAAEAFFRVLQAIRRGSGPADNVRAYLFTVVRRLAAEQAGRNRDVPVADEELNRRVGPDADRTDARVDAHLIARAFSSLPQRWRNVLWHVEVEGERPAVVAGQFGLSANATAALARRARDGLRAAYLQAHVTPPAGPTGCRSVVDKLGAYTAGQLRGAEVRRIRAHLTTCSDCARLQAELADVCAGLRRHAGTLVPPVLIGGGLSGHVVSGSLTAKLAALGARMKIALVTASVALVGGAGLAVGPLLVHSGPSVHADYDHDVLPIVGTPARPTGGPAGATIAHTAASPYTTRSSASPTQHSSGTTPPRQPAGLGVTNHMTQPVVTTTTPANQLQDGTDPSGDNTGDSGDAAAPMITQTSDDPAASGSGQPVRHGKDNRTASSTVWSTVYTTDGTTIWETVWEWTDPN